MELQHIQSLRSQIVILNEEKEENLKSQIATSSLRSQFATLEIEESKNRRGKHSKYLPYAFTEPRKPIGYQHYNY